MPFPYLCHRCANSDGGFLSGIGGTQHAYRGGLLARKKHVHGQTGFD